jgi:hypothetical protein
VDEGQTEGDGVVSGTEDDADEVASDSAGETELARTGGSLAPAVAGGTLLALGSGLAAAARRRRA